MNLSKTQKGIPHIEDLDISTFLKIINDLEEYEVTEKIDGSQILFGIDQNGFYTSRESKGGKRVYSIQDYEIQFSTTYRRAVHKLLESVLPQLKESGLKIGDQIEAEVLYGELPNVVPYSEKTSYLIFLRTTAGDTNINELKKRFEGSSFSIAIDTPTTVDGRKIKIIEKLDRWVISSVPRFVVQTRNVQSECDKTLKDIQKYLSQNTKFGINNKLLDETPLNKIPAWCLKSEWKNIKEELKLEKAKVRDELSKMKTEVKEILIDHLVRPYTSAFGPRQGGWIEGVVLRHQKNNQIVKIVDKNVFGVIRNFAWKIRNSLTDKPKGLNNNYSYLGEVYVGLATLMGHPKLGTMQSKRYNKDTVIEKEVVLDCVKKDMLIFLAEKEHDLECRLDKYEKEKCTLILKVIDGTFNRKISYVDSSIDRRTKETFSTSFATIKTLMDKISVARSTDDLIYIIAG